MFLTGSLLVTTIVAVSATKGIKRALPFYYYQKGNVCVYVAQYTLCEIGAPVCKYTDAVGTYQEYAIRINPSLCQNVLQPE